MTTINLYDPRIDQEASKTLIRGDTVTVLEYQVRAICDNGRVGLDGGVYPGPFKDQSLWQPLYRSVNDAITEIIEQWMIDNVESIAPVIFKFPYKLGLFTLETGMGVSDGGEPYITTLYKAQSEHGTRFIQSPAGERARLMASQMASDYIDRLGRENPV